MKKKDYNDIIEDMRKRKVVSIMGRQIVFVGGKRFTIITDESEEYMKNIVERLDTRLRSIISTNPKLDKDSAALLASLDYCDEEYKIKKKLDENKEQMKQYLSEITRLHMEIDSLKREKKEMQIKINKILNVDPDDVVTEKPSEKKIIATGKIEKSVPKILGGAVQQSLLTILRNKSKVYEKIEILAPAGSFESVISAVRSGADAVYLGLQDFLQEKKQKTFLLKS